MTNNYTLKPVCQNDGWQLALFNNIANKYFSPHDALLELRRLYRQDELYFFGKYAIKVSLLTNELITDIFRAKHDFDIDILRQKEVIKNNV